MSGFEAVARIWPRRRPWVVAVGLVVLAGLSLAGRSANAGAGNAAAGATGTTSAADADSGTVAASGTAAATSVATKHATTWADVAKWPDFTGGVWVSPGAEGSPHAEDLPLNAAARAFIQRYGKGYGSGAATCAPRGMPWSLGNQFIYSRGLIVILGAPDYYQVLRRVYMDGRGHGDPDPTYFGHSIGHWEGDTLVIDTTGFLPEELLTEGLPSYGRTHIIERYRLLARGRLQLRLTVSNPALLTHDWTQTRVYQLQRGEQVPEAYCTNNRDQGDAANLTPPPTLPPLPGVQP